MIIGIMSPKGGCGKSTTTMTLASSLATNPHLTIAIVDADPRQAIGRLWLQKRTESEDAKAPFQIVSETREANIIDALDRLDETADIVIVDLEGVAGLMSSYVASRSDLCIVPMRPSALDGDAAGSALSLIDSAGKVSRREIPAYVLLTQTDAAIATKSYKQVIDELDTESVPRFKVELQRRAPFERMMAEGRTLYELNPTKSVASAKENAMALATELIEILEKI